MLVVFLAKDGAVGLHDVQELQHHGQDPVKVAGAGASTEVPGQKIFGHRNRAVRAVEGLRLREKHVVDSLLSAVEEILVEWLRVVLQVFRAVELDGVDEDRGDDCPLRAGLFPGGAEELSMPLMKSAHGGDEGQGAGGEGEGLAQGVHAHMAFQRGIHEGKVGPAGSLGNFPPVRLTGGRGKDTLSGKKPCCSSKDMILKFLKVSLLMAALSSSAFGQLKIATVNMEKLFNDFYRTSEVQKAINIERARIQKDNNLRLADIRKIDDKMQEIRKKLKSDIGAKQKQDLGQEAKELQQDGIHKERERTEFLERRNRALNEKMRKQMRSILLEIQDVVSEKAKTGNYDYILDKSGNTNQGIPFVLHAKESVDLTEGILNEINAEAKEASK